MSINVSAPLQGSLSIMVGEEIIVLGASHVRMPAFSVVPRPPIAWEPTTICATFKCTGGIDLWKWPKRLDQPGKCYVRPRSAKMRRARRLKYWRPE
jgi:hypothetical protein